nr:hypothetical protein CFP56_38744 [Quercus suber]
MAPRWQKGIKKASLIIVRSAWVKLARMATRSSAPKGVTIKKAPMTRDQELMLVVGLPPRASQSHVPSGTSRARRHVSPARWFVDGIAGGSATYVDDDHCRPPHPELAKRFCPLANVSRAGRAPPNHRCSWCYDERGLAAS